VIGDTSSAAASAHLPIGAGLVAWLTPGTIEARYNGGSLLRETKISG
jgi:hypothetical protein